MMHSSRPRHIRELASQYKLSPAGVSDIIRRLKEAGVLTESRQANRRKLSLKLSKLEHECLSSFFLIQQNIKLKERAARFSKNAAKKLLWMDEAYQFYHKLKRDRNDPS